MLGVTAAFTLGLAQRWPGPLPAILRRLLTEAGTRLLAEDATLLLVE